MKRKLTAGQTSVSVPIFIQDTSSTTGGGLSGLTSATSGLVAEYRRRGQSAWTAITLTSKTLGTWTSGGFVADGALAGAYELDLPDAVCASGARWVAVRLRGAANMLPCLIEIELDAFDYQTATQPVNVTQISGDATAADNAESFFDGTGYAGTNNVIPTVSTVTNGVTVTTNNDKTGYSLASGGLSAISTWTVAITGNITGSVGSVVGNVGGSVASVTAGVTVTTNNDKTGYSLTQSFPTHFASMQIAANGHVSAVVESMANNSITASAIQGDAITAAKIAADAVTEIQSGLATQSSLDTLIQYVDTEVAAIKLVTDKVDTMVEVDGLVYRYTTNALEQAPAGGGGGGTDWTADERTAIRTILGIPGSGTTPADPSDGVLYDIKQKTDQIGSAGAITNLLAGAVLDPGTITSFPSELVIGDSYQETDGREIQIPLVDTDGNVLTTVGSRNLADATATFEIRRINESDSTRVITGVATIVDPPGTGTTTALGAPYAVIELPASETLKGLPSYRYYGKITLEWAGPGTDIMSFKTDVIKFTY